MSIMTLLSDLSNQKKEAVEQWFSTKRTEAEPHITTSVDMRHNGTRLVPVDANIYPAGFQNLSQHGIERAATQFETGIKSRVPHAKRILIIPENHTRNLPYLDNLVALRTILLSAGFEVEIGSLIAEDAPLELEMQSGKFLNQAPLIKHSNILETKAGFKADVILLNNDGTAGIPEKLQHISQPIFPSPEYGWFQRKKSCHFKAYAELAKHFAMDFGIDPWLISANFDHARNVNFKERQGVDVLAEKVDVLVQKIKTKHAEYGITDDPFVYVKADSGTYGMGIMQVHGGSELLEMNKKQRNKMHVIKEGAEVHDVIIQEGIKTIDSVEGKAAEPMVYLVDGVPVGGMFRVNANRDAYGNLNASGMEYIGMCDEGETGKNSHQVSGCNFAAYGLIGAISALAAGREKYTQVGNQTIQACA